LGETAGNWTRYEDVIGVTRFAFEEPVNTIMFVSGRNPEAIEEDLQRRGLKVEWANSIRAAKKLLASASERTAIVADLALADLQLDRSDRASKVYLKLHSHCACKYYQYGRVVV